MTIFAKRSRAMGPPTGMTRTDGLSMSNYVPCAERLCALRGETVFATRPRTEAIPHASTLVPRAWAVPDSVPIRRPAPTPRSASTVH